MYLLGLEHGFGFCTLLRRAKIILIHYMEPKMSLKMPSSNVAEITRGVEIVYSVPAPHAVLSSSPIPQ
jgi:hypothetical protein